MAKRRKKSSRKLNRPISPPPAAPPLPPADDSPMDEDSDHALEMDDSDSRSDEENSGRISNNRFGNSAAAIGSGGGGALDLTFSNFGPIASIKSDDDEAARLKPGIIYLSSLPPGWNVAQTTMFFAQFGRVGRVFLQPEKNDKHKKNKVARMFSEGWVEFMSKKVARDVANNLNNTQVGGKKRSKSHEVIWNIKYLPRFKWTHLSERLAYEKAVHQQKMRTEISQAKRQADFFQASVEKSRRGREKQAKKDVDGEGNKRQRKYEFRQKEPEDTSSSSTGSLRSRKRVGSADSGPAAAAAAALHAHSPPANKKKKRDESAAAAAAAACGKKPPSKRCKSAAAAVKPARHGRAGAAADEDGADRATFLQSVFGSGN